jgi:hypothetical protein
MLRGDQKLLLATSVCAAANPAPPAGWVKDWCSQNYRNAAATPAGIASG